MSRIFITGSTDGLGRAAAAQLVGAGHDVILHARSEARARDIADLADRAAGLVTADLANAEAVRALAGQVNALGPLDAVIHNAGIYPGSTRELSPEGHSVTFAVNVLAPYVLTALIERPSRLIYLSSSMHRVPGPIDDLDWAARRWDATQAYSESKFWLTAMALGLARRWPDVLVSAVDPGWVPTKMGGASATDDLQKGHETQAWLAVSDDAAARESGGYWHHARRQSPDAEAADPALQDALLEKLAQMTGVPLPERIGAD